jgi:hypothetical protein
MGLASTVILGFESHETHELISVFLSKNTLKDSMETEQPVQRLATGWKTEGSEFESP